MEGWTMIRTRYHEDAVTHCLRLDFRLQPYRAHNSSVRSGIEPGLRARIGLRRRGGLSPRSCRCRWSFVLAFYSRRRRQW
jgi:hypothetical protein